MRAWTIEKFGCSEQLTITDITPEALGPKDVRVRAICSAINPVDWKIREGFLAEVLPHRFPIVLGWDVSGVVDEIGDQVCSVRVGDRVMAYARKDEVSRGAFAEQICLPESHLAQIPEGVSYAEAAALPLVSLTAYQTLKNHLKVKTDQTLLVTGGAGGVGSMAIQLAKSWGANVISTASHGNHEYLKQLGADHLIDYRNQEVTKECLTLCPGGVDAIFDCVGGESLVQGFAVIKNEGRLVSIVEEPDTEQAQKKQLYSTFMFVEPNGAQLTAIAHLVRDKKLQTPAIREASIMDLPRLLDENQERHVRGKVVCRNQFA